MNRQTEIQMLHTRVAELCKAYDGLVQLMNDGTHRSDREMYELLTRFEMASHLMRAAIEDLQAVQRMTWWRKIKIKMTRYVG